jgi:transposase
MEIKITDKEKKELLKLHRIFKDKKSCDRIKAIILLSEGYTVTEVSKILLIDDETVRRWKTRYETKTNELEWLEDNYTLYSGKITEEEKQIIEKYVRENIISDSKQIIEYIEEQLSKEYSHDGIVKLLHRMGFEYKKTTMIPSKYDEDAQKKFKRKYEKMIANKGEDEVILFVDGVHPQHNTASSYAWIKKGEERKIKSNTGRSRLNIHGAYNPETCEVLVHEDKTLQTESTIEFLKEIENHYKSKTEIKIILDNARYYKNKEIDKYLKTSRIKLIYLPPYSPNLNLIERLWKYLRKKVINNRYYETFIKFRDAVFDFFENIDEMKSDLKTFIGNKLHLFPA